MANPMATCPVQAFSHQPDQTSPPGTSQGIVLLGWLAPLLSGGLLYLSFFPLNWGFLAWFALLPLLCLVRLPQRPRRLYLACWIGALAFYLPVLQWARVADPRMYVTWIFLALYCAAYLPILLALVRRLDRRTNLPLVLVFPTVWVALEWVRWGLFGGFFLLLRGSPQHDLPGGFSWYFLGHTQHDLLEIIQIADLTGVYGVSFVIASVNALLFEILYFRYWFRLGILGQPAPPPGSKTRLLVQALAVSLLLLVTLSYGKWRLTQQTSIPGPRIALLQCNLDQRLRNRGFGQDEQARQNARQQIHDQFRDLAQLAARARPDLIVTAETSYPGYWEEFAPGKPTKYSRDLAENMASDLRTPVLLGMNAAVAGHDGKIRSYNSAILLDREGAWLGRYDKIHRVPFGEYIPLRGWVPFLHKLAPYDFDYTVSVGEAFTRFPLDGPSGPYSFGVLICYEDTDPAMARPYVSSQPVDFLLNLSNDGWFDGTSEHDQHLALCRFRAIETRRAIGRAVNMGISAIIDSNGRVLAPSLLQEFTTIPVWEIPQPPDSLPPSEWHRFKQIAGVLLGNIPMDSRTSLYAQFGDAFALACLGLLLLTSIRTYRVRRERHG